MRFVTVVGARPTFVKAAVLSAELRREHNEVLVHTGQHYDVNMSDVFFRELGIPAPDRYLEVGSGPQGAQTSAMLERMEVVLEELQPDAVILYGDTNSALAGVLAAAKLQIPVAHVEAGLRSFNRAMPEEINRIVVDRLSQWLFAPSAKAVEHLATEGITEGVYDVGDIMADSVRHFSPLACERSTILERLSLKPGEYCVATVHRAGNTDVPVRLAGILEGLSLAPVPVVLPLHPRTKAALERDGHDVACLSASEGACEGKDERLLVIEPVGYLDMLQLQSHAAMVLTDSGGMQKEAYFLGVPCVTLRDETEWVETVEVGWNCLAGADPERIATAARKALGRREDHPVLYGDGHAAERMVRILGN